MMHRKPGFLSIVCTTAALSLSAHAQQVPALAQPTVRITRAVSDQALVTLKGNTSPRAKTQFDQGIADSSLGTGRLMLLLRPGAAQQSALREYLGALQDPHSASYHKWLTPAAYGANFGISDQDLQTVENWLLSEGFTIDSVPASRNFIRFSGTFGTVAQAFHTTMHAYRINGVTHYANASDPSIPAALAPVVQGISPLNDFRAKPTFVQQLRGQARTTAGHVQMVSTASRGATPAYTGTLGNATYLLVTPGDAATIYDSPNAYNANFTGSSTETGAGIKIGLVGDSDLPLQDYLNYRSLFLNEGGSPKQPTLVVDGTDPGQINDGSSEEALVDTELSAGLAPGAGIYFYSSADDLLQSGPLDAAIRAIEDNQVSILSMSFSECESDLGPGGNAEVEAIWQQAAAQGITVLVSSGDTGPASCDDDAGDLNQAQYGFSVNGLGSTPYNVSVGGTDFDTLSNDFAQYVSTANSASTYYRSTAGYIPENPWDESISNNPPGSYINDTAQQYTSSSDSTPFTILAAGGGGPSTAAVCSAGTDSNGDCLGPETGYPTPSFQTGISVAGQNPDTAATGVRYLPDVSLFASSGSEHPATWLLCADSAVTGDSSSYTDCEADNTGAFGFDGIGGTSTASPAFAGILAMVSQSQGGARLGVADNTLYNLYATNSNASSIFHDITVGNNSVPCVSGSPNCGSNGFLTGFNAATGYDLATGLGSVDISKLISGWSQVQFTATTTTLTAGTSSGSLGTSPITITHGANVTLNAQVSPTSAVGSVSVTGPAGQAGLAVTETIPLTSGAGSVTVDDLPGGSYTVTGYYPGDVSHSPSSSTTPIQFTISPEASAPFLYTYSYDLSGGAGTENPSSIPYGSYAYAYVQPGNSAGTTSHGVATGTVTLLNGKTAFSTSAFSATETLNSQGEASYPLFDLPPATYALNAQYSGDDSYNASATSTAQSLVISQGPTALTVHVGSATAANPGAIQVELDTDSIGAYPTDAVTLTVNGTSYKGTAANETQADSAVDELVTFAVPASAFSGSGGYTLAATYPGDPNYSSSAAGSCTYVPPTTTARLGTDAMPRHGHPFIAAAGCGLCSLLLLLVPARRRAWRSLLVVFFAVGLLGITGCGTSTNGGGTSITLHGTCSK